MLVRQDGHVAARWPSAPGALPRALQAALGTILRLGGQEATDAVGEPRPVAIGGLL
ncbi:MAG: hypothetical protein JOY58_03605 [Solirubrobacterales bacterium]|nr:hypothetical protein [Solirubrobacterales bacterium]